MGITSTLGSWRSVVAVIVFLVGSTGGSSHFVNPGVVLVENWEGWGTSMAWWPDVLGAMPQDVIDTVNSAFFSKDKLNLNILRYTIGGTTPGDYKCGGYRDGGATESFLDGPDQEYDWSRDPRQRSILLAAKELGVDTFEAFSNSPPQWMTVSGCSKGNDGGGSLHNNFDAVNASAFADYATEVIRHYKDFWNITFQSYAPYNEPSGLNGNGYWTGSNQNQEGCSMTLSVMSEILKAMSAAIQEKGMDYVQLSIADETQINQAIVTQDYFYQQGLSNLATKLNVHGYSDSGNNRRDLLKMQANRDGHRLWMDEMGWSSFPLGEMDQGLNVASRIVTDIRGMLPSAWVYWQAMEDDGAWGLLSLPYKDPSVENIKYHSGYYSLMQFTKYIPKGSQFIHISDERAVAAVDPTTNDLIIVIVNPTDSDTENVYDIELFAPASEIRGTRTSKFEQNVEIPPPASDFATKYFNYTAPPRSVTTFVIPGTASTAKQVNMIPNADFENGDDGSWYIVGGKVDSSYVFSGNYSVVFNPMQEKAFVTQEFVIPFEEGDWDNHWHYLTAWVKTGGGYAEVEVEINPWDTKDPRWYKQTYSSDVGYQMVSLSFLAGGGDYMYITFLNQLGQGYSYLDDIRIHKSV